MLDIIFYFFLSCGYELIKLVHAFLLIFFMCIAIFIFICLIFKARNVFIIIIFLLMIIFPICNGVKYDFYYYYYLFSLFNGTGYFYYYYYHYNFQTGLQNKKQTYITNKSMKGSQTEKKNIQTDILICFTKGD